MKHTELEIEISNLEGKKWKKVKGLVDTGATLTTIPKSLADELEIKEIREEEIETAAGRIKIKRGNARIKIGNKEEIVPIWISDIIDRVLIGSVTLEVFGLSVDPVTGKLIEKSLILY